MDRRLLFLPGAGADPDFWKPLGNLLPVTWEKVYFGWPGLGNQKYNPDIKSLDDLVSIVENSLDDSQTDLLAQSMGGHVAVRILLKHPDKIRKVVFTGTGAGLNLTDYGGEDWKPDYRRKHPHAAIEIMNEIMDFTSDIPKITQPALILCGDADSICPVKVGERLLQLLPDAKLRIVQGGNHTFVRDNPQAISEYIIDHLK